MAVILRQRGKSMLAEEFRMLLELLRGSNSAPLVPMNERMKPVVRKQCLQCGEKHFHHNDFCSRDCCLQYKVAHRGK